MALLLPIPGSYQTQGFGPSPLALEPAMWADSRRAWWQPLSGMNFVQHMHPALDLAAAEGTHIVASESGTVSGSGYDGNNGGGNFVEVQIRTGTRYRHSHMAVRSVSTGQKVARGQLLGTVGHSGTIRMDRGTVTTADDYFIASATGNHSHFSLSLLAGAIWVFWNPSLFLPGGALAGDVRIKPLVTTHYAYVNKGVNVRTSPRLTPLNIYGTTGGVGRLINILPTTRLLYGGSVTGDSYGTGNLWSKVWINSAYRYVARPFVRIT